MCITTNCERLESREWPPAQFGRRYFRFMEMYARVLPVKSLSHDIAHELSFTTVTLLGKRSSK